MFSQRLCKLSRTSTYFPVYIFNQYACMHLHCNHIQRLVKHLEFSYFNQHFMTGNYPQYKMNHRFISTTSLFIPTGSEMLILSLTQATISKQGNLSHIAHDQHKVNELCLIRIEHVHITNKDPEGSLHNYNLVLNQYTNYPMLGFNWYQL